MKAKDLIKLLKKNGFKEKRTPASSHRIYTKNGFPPISVPYHTKDIPLGTLNKILKDAGLK